MGPAFAEVSGCRGFRRRRSHSPTQAAYTRRVVAPPPAWPRRPATVRRSTPAVKLVESDVPTLRMPRPAASHVRGIRQPGDPAETTPAAPPAEPAHVPCPLPLDGQLCA